MALKQFLQLLVWLRRVLIQDAAVLFSHDSTYPIFQHSIFKTAAFHRFCEELTTHEEFLRCGSYNLGAEGGDHVGYDGSNGKDVDDGLIPPTL